MQSVSPSAIAFSSSFRLAEIFLVRSVHVLKLELWLHPKSLLCSMPDNRLLIGIITLGPQPEFDILKSSCLETPLARKLGSHGFPHLHIHFPHNHHHYYRQARVWSALMENYQIHGVINRAAAGQNGKWKMGNEKRTGLPAFGRLKIEFNLTFASWQPYVHLCGNGGGWGWWWEGSRTKFPSDVLTALI